jgi:hypothetical protein
VVAPAHSRDPLALRSLLSLGLVAADAAVLRPVRLRHVARINRQRQAAVFAGAVREPAASMVTLQGVLQLALFGVTAIGAAVLARHVGGTLRGLEERLMHYRSPGSVTTIFPVPPALVVTSIVFELSPVAEAL